MSTRDAKRMVAEDDPGFMKFWNGFPKRVSKKEARIAYKQLDPSAAIVDAIVAALAWQVPAFKWDGENYDFCPFPATWIRKRRWEDERRQTPRNGNGNAAQSETTDDYLERIGWCSHEPRCTDSDVCRAKRAAARNGSAATTAR